MHVPVAKAFHSNRTLVGVIIVAASLAVAGCTSKHLSSPTSTNSETTTTAAAMGDGGTTTTAATTGDGVTTTTSPVAASETTAPDVARGTPIVTSLPTTTIESATTIADETTTTIEPTATSAGTPSGCVSCAADFVFPYSSYFDVPQLGTEPVRGTGCGSDGTLGDIIPDGIWNAHSIVISASSLAIDVQCVYYGDAAQQLLANCEASDPGSCQDNDTNFWFVNASSRLRIMPLDSHFRRRYADQDLCEDPGPGNDRGTDVQDAFDSWVFIEQGHATFALTSCAYG